MPPQPGKVIIRPRQRGAGRTAQQQGSSYTDGDFQRAAFASRMIGPPAVQRPPQQLGTQQKVAEWDGKHARHAIQQYKAAGAASRQQIIAGQHIINSRAVPRHDLPEAKVVRVQAPPRHGQALHQPAAPPGRGGPAGFAVPRPGGELHHHGIQRHKHQHSGAPGGVLARHPKTQAAVNIFIARRIAQQQGDQHDPLRIFGCRK